MQTSFIISNPKHQKYQNGKLEFEFHNGGSTLKKLHFYLDDKYYYAPMSLYRRETFSTAWIFQKPYSLKPLNSEELQTIALLAKDILNSHRLSKTTENLIFAIQTQAKLYDDIKHKNLNEKEKKILKGKFQWNNLAIHKFNDYRYGYLNQHSK